MQRIFSLLWLTVGLGAALSAQDSTYQLRVMHYNLMAFGVAGNGCSFDVGRYQTLRTVMNHYRPHLFTVNEVGPSELYRRNIVSQCLRYNASMVAVPLIMERNSDRTSLLFYDESLFGFRGTLPCPDDDCVLSSSGVRDILVYELFFRPSAQQGGDTTFLNLIVAHFKASDGSANENQRAQSAREIVRWVQNKAPNSNVLLLADHNIGYGGEPAWQTLVNNADPSLNLIDPLNQINGWRGSANAELMTQSTRRSGSGCFVGGGLDDRFDAILMSDEVDRGQQGVLYQAGSYAALGNSGRNFDEGLSCGDNPTVPSNVCNALYNTSDHLPVVMTLEMGGATTSERITWESELRIGPQPMQDGLRVQVQSAATQSGWQLSIRDALGRAIWEQVGAPDWRVEVRNWPAGVYLLYLTDPNGTLLQRKLLKSVE